MRRLPVLGLSSVLGMLIWPALALGATGPAPPVEPPVVDPWDTVRTAVASLAALTVLIAIVVAAIRIPAARPLIAFVAIAGAFSILALIVGFGVSLSHMDTGMTDFERTTLTIEVGALFVAGIVFGGFVARWAHRRLA